MKKPLRFVERFASLIVSVLSCYDRVIFKGYLPFRNGQMLESFVDHVLKIRRKDFMSFANRKSDALLDHAQHLARQAPGGYQFLKGRHDKDKFVDNLVRKHRITDGLICVLCTMECCRSFRLKYGKGRPRLQSDRRQQRVLYYYYLDRDFGMLHVRLETWFPFTIQIAVNAHEWLARQMQKKRMGFCLQDNAFTQLDNPAAAQRIADRFVRVHWPRRLSGLAHRVNPLLKERWLKHWNRYYWVTDQAEYATDLLFRSRQALDGLYPRLLDHATLNFSAQDILGFLGRRLHGRFDGEVLTACRKDRWPGARIKHRMKNNWLKMYDKFALILRIETVINNPREFKVRRLRTAKGQRRMLWCPMNKGVCNLPHYQHAAHTANHRYLDGLARVDEPTRAYRHLKPLARRQVVKGRSYAPFNPACPEDQRLFKAVLDANHLIHGFRNADIRRAVFGEPRRGNKTVRHVQRRRQSHKTSRLLKRLHVRKLIAKVPRTRRWRITDQGQHLLNAAVTLYHRDLNEQLATAA